jgi:guanylate kinase
MTPGPLIIVSGPSGSGKSTLIRRVLAVETRPLRLAVSVTTRPPRPGEKEGVEYYFWSRERFEEQLPRGAFLEHAVVHGQHYYGTPRSEVDGYRERGVGVILDVDVQGAAQVRRVYPEHLSIFIALSRWPLYEQRIKLRGSETPESIVQRLATARCELSQMKLYQHVIYNDDLESAVARFREVLANYVAGQR